MSVGVRFRRRLAALVGAGLLVGASGCAATKPVERKQVESPAVLDLRPVFEGVRADARARIVEFDAEVSPILVKDERAPLVFLEVLVCTPGTREHETLLVAKALPSHVHAALLAVGVEPGTPGGFEFVERRLRTIDPTGARVNVQFLYDDSGRERSVDPLDWVVSAGDGTGLRASAALSGVGFVFAGSKMVNVRGGERYAGDLGGNVVGLTTFGDEVIALSKAISPEAGVQAPEWVARLDATPAPGTAVRVRLRLE